MREKILNPATEKLTREAQQDQQLIYHQKRHQPRSSGMAGSAQEKKRGKAIEQEACT
jgi:hypothetical protein